jgi:hypothetical protein
MSKKPKTKVYAIGSLLTSQFTHGPTRNLRKLLEEIPVVESHVIAQLVHGPRSNKTIYIWDTMQRQWIKPKQKEPVVGTKKFVARPVYWAIDPGNKESGWAQFRLDPAHPSGISIMCFGKTENRQLRKLMHQFRSEKGHIEQGSLAIEMMRARGMPTANEEFQTCVEIGRFLQTWGGSSWSYMFRGDVKVEICGSAKAKDPNIRAALIELWGGEAKAIGGKRCKKCHGKGWLGRDHDECPACKGLMWAHPPGPLYGVAADAWAAIALAVAWVAAGKQLVHKSTSSLAKRRNMQ